MSRLPVDPADLTVPVDPVGPVDPVVEPASRLAEDRAAGPAPPACTGSITEDALASCFAHDYERLVGLARLLVDQRAEAEEVVQEAFVRVYAARRNLRDAEVVLPYVRQAVVNVARGGLRRRITERRHRDHESAGERPEIDHRQDTGDIVESRQRDEQLVGAVRRLPRRQREVVALRYLDELSTAETAVVLGCSEGSVKAYLHRALARLRAELETS